MASYSTEITLTWQQPQEDRDLKKGETYYYVVKAIRGKKYSGNSNKAMGKLE